MGYAIGWALGIGLGAVAAGAFVGFLVNGPPRSTLPRTIADVAPPTPAKPAVETKTAAATAPETTTPTPPAKTEAAPPAHDSLPPLRPPAAKKAPEPLVAAEVRDAQSRLRGLGFNPGPIDGAAGPQTAAAVKQYQQARGLEATGTLDKELLARLQKEQPQHHAQTAPPPRRTYAPPPRRQQQQDPLLESIERLFRR
jgi:peptidoglycan hydrolase-like protein with peptidoglycan-binding domain